MKHAFCEKQNSTSHVTSDHFNEFTLTTLDSFTFYSCIFKLHTVLLQRVIGTRYLWYWAKMIYSWIIISFVKRIKLNEKKLNNGAYTNT